MKIKNIITKAFTKQMNWILFYYFHALFFRVILRKNKTAIKKN